MRRAPALLAVAFALAGCGQSDQPAATDDPAAESATPAESAEPAAAVEPTTAMGEPLFKRCVACHTIDKGGSNGIGPNLHGVVGRAVASVPDFAYSGAMRAKGGVWDAAALDAYLADPMKTLPGTRMAFAGVIDPGDRKALILYLEDQSR